MIEFIRWELLSLVTCPRWVWAGSGDVLPNARSAELNGQRSERLPVAFQVGSVPLRMARLQGDSSECKLLGRRSMCPQESGSSTFEQLRDSMRIVNVHTNCITKPPVEPSILASRIGRGSRLSAPTLISYSPSP